MKHFLETSIVRTLCASTNKTQEYYRKNLGERRYISSYIRMEFIRGFLIPAMQFHNVFYKPNIETTQDVISWWGHTFKKRELSAICGLFVGLLSSRRNRLDFFSEDDRFKAARIVGDYVRRVYYQIPKQYKDIGIDKDLCKKLDAVFDFKPLEIHQSFKAFIEQFNDKDNYQQCKLQVFLQKREVEIQRVIASKDLKIANARKDGFNAIIKVLENNPRETFTCKHCSQIGDLLIALISPKDMRLETLDQSFTYLMTILEKDFYKHDSERKIIG